jgi:hypothetical protein
MSYNYVVVDSSGSLVSSSFHTPRTSLRFPASNRPTESAVVSINGTKIGVIGPHPWININAFYFDTTILTFPHAVLIPSPLSFSATISSDPDSLDSTASGSQ